MTLTSGSSGLSLVPPGQLSFPQVLFSDPEVASHTGNTDETTIKTYTIPGGSIGANGYFKVEFAAFAGANNANAKTVRIRFGGTSLFATPLANVLSNRFEVWAAANGTTGGVKYSLANGYTTSASAIQALSIDTSVDQDITITATLASAGDTAGVGMVRIEACYKE